MVTRRSSLAQGRGRGREAEGDQQQHINGDRAGNGSVKVKVVGVNNSVEAKSVSRDLSAPSTPTPLPTRRSTRGGAREDKTNDDKTDGTAENMEDDQTMIISPSSARRYPSRSLRGAAGNDNNNTSGVASTSEGAGGVVTGVEEENAGAPHALTAGEQDGAAMDGEAAATTGVIVNQEAGDSTVTIDGEIFSDIASVYAFLRTFSWQCRLSPFSLKTFACALASQQPCQMIDEIHVSLLRFLLLDATSQERADFPVRIDFLDHLTWPEFIWSYLESKHEQRIREEKAAIIANAPKGIDQMSLDEMQKTHPQHDPLVKYKFQTNSQNSDLAVVTTRAKEEEEEEEIKTKTETAADSLADFKKDYLNFDVTWGLDLSLDVVEKNDNTHEEREEAQEPTSSSSPPEEDSFRIKLDLDWGKEKDELVEKLKEAFQLESNSNGEPTTTTTRSSTRNEHQQHHHQQQDTVKTAKEYSLLDLRGKVSILQRLCDDFLDTSLIRCELYQREELGLRGVQRFATLMHTLHSKVEAVKGGKGSKGGPKKQNPFAAGIQLQNTPRKRGRPPKALTADYLANTPKTPKQKKKRLNPSVDLDYIPKSSARFKRTKNIVVEESDEEDHNLDACVLCGLGGRLVCCEGCPAAFHVKCGGESSKVISAEDMWLCEECRLREKEGRCNDTLHKDLMQLKKVTCAPRTGAKTSTWQIQEFAFQCRVLNTELPQKKQHSSRRRSKSKGKGKKDTGPKYYEGSQAPFEVEWTCKLLPVRHPILKRDEAAQYLSDGFGDEIVLHYYKESLDHYMNKYRYSWHALQAEMSGRTKSQKSHTPFLVSKYAWPTRIGRGQKALQKLPLCSKHPSAHMLIVFLSKTERDLWGLLEGNWANYPNWRSKWIHSVFHAQSPQELSRRLMELEESLLTRALVPRWFEAADKRLLTNRMRADPTQEIRTVAKKIELKIDDHKVGEYLDRPGSFVPVIPLRPGAWKKPHPQQVYPTEEPMFTWKRNKKYLGTTPKLPRKQCRQLGRQAGVIRAHGCSYPNPIYGILSKQQEWRVRAEKAKTFSEVALLMRDFTAALKWEEIQFIPELQKGLKILRCKVVEDEDGETEEMALLTSESAINPTAYECEWRPTEDVPLKMLKNFKEIDRLENSKSDRYFLRREHLHPGATEHMHTGLTGLNVAVYWPEEGRWCDAQLEIQPKDRRVKIRYPSGQEESLDKLTFEQVLENQEISVEPTALKQRLAMAKEQDIRDEQMKHAKESRLKEEKEKRDKERKEREAARTLLTPRDIIRLNLVNKAILDACVRISTGKDTSKGKKSKEFVASLIPRTVLDVLLDRAEKGELKPYCLESHKPLENDTRSLPAGEAGEDDDDLFNEKKVAIEKKYTPDPSEMNKPARKHCLGILERMGNFKNEAGEEIAQVFQNLPSRKALPEYYRVITAPIDIGSITAATKKTKHPAYPKVQDFIAAVELMFTNAKTYNHDTSTIYHNADVLRKWFWKEIGEYFPHIDKSNWEEGISEIAPLPQSKMQKAKEPKPKKVQGPKPPKQKSLRDKLQIALSVIRDVMRLPESYSFHDPVDCEAIPIYSTIVKTPMDLGTIRTKLEAGRELGWDKIEYTSEEEVLRDMKLVWENCRTFNNPEDPVYRQCEVIAPVGEELWQLRMSCTAGRKYHITTDRPEIVLNTPESCIDFRVGVWWPRSFCFFYGTIAEFEKDTGKHKIHYDDGQIQSVTLVKHQIHWIDDKFNFKYGCASTDGKPVEKKPETEPPTAGQEEEGQKEGEEGKKEDAPKDEPPKERPKYDAPRKYEAVGWRVGVPWHKDGTFYYGMVHSYDEETRKHVVIYDDGTMESVTVNRLKIDWVEQTLAEDERQVPPEVENVVAEVEEKPEPEPEPEPAPAPAEKADAIGWRVGVWWESDEVYYYGVIKDYSKKEKTHRILFEDDAEEWLDLSREKVEWKEKVEEVVADVKKIKVIPPAFAPPKKEAAIGWRVGVWWESDEVFYYGVIKDYSKKEKTHHILFEDDADEWLDLSKEKVEWKDKVEETTNEDEESKKSSNNKGKGEKKAAAQKKEVVKKIKVIPPAASAPSFTPPKKEDAIGWRVAVPWAEDNTVYYGIVYSYDAETRKHIVIYEDGTMETLLLSRVKLDWVEKTIPTWLDEPIVDPEQPPPPGQDPATPTGKKRKVSTVTKKASKRSKSSGKSKKAKNATAEDDESMPGFVAPKQKEAIGWRVGIWWDDDMSFYYGAVKGYNKKDKKHQILYDDGVDEWLDLSKEKVDWKEEQEEGNVETLVKIGKLLEKHKSNAQSPPGKEKANKKKTNNAKGGKGKALINKRVGIFWSDDKCFYYGVITEFNEAENKHHVKYDDGTDEWMDLSKEESVDWNGGSSA
jgi:hypothetical protein